MLNHDAALVCTNNLIVQTTAISCSADTLSFVT